MHRSVSSPWWWVKALALALAFIIVFVLCRCAANATNYYIDCFASTNVGWTGDGTSWANAWTNFGTHLQSPGSITAGDTIYVSGGNYDEYVPISDFAATELNPITLAASQEAGHNGFVWIRQISVFDSAPNWVIRGAKTNGLEASITNVLTMRQPVTNNIGMKLGMFGDVDAPPLVMATATKLQWIEFNNTNNVSGGNAQGIVCQRSYPHVLTGGEIAYCWVHYVQVQGIVANNGATTNPVYGAFRVHHNIIENYGDVGVDAGNGVEIDHNFFGLPWLDHNNGHFGCTRVAGHIRAHHNVFTGHYAGDPDIYTSMQMPDDGYTLVYGNIFYEPYGWDSLIGSIGGTAVSYACNEHVFQPATFGLSYPYFVVFNGGSGYADGDLLALDGGVTWSNLDQRATFYLTNVVAGAATNHVVNGDLLPEAYNIYRGEYTNIPAGPLYTTTALTGGGSGCVLSNASWTISQDTYHAMPQVWTNCVAFNNTFIVRNGFLAGLGTSQRHSSGVNNYQMPTGQVYLAEMNLMNNLMWNGGLGVGDTGTAGHDQALVYSSAQAAVDYNATTNVLYMNSNYTVAAFSSAFPALNHNVARMPTLANPGIYDFRLTAALPGTNLTALTNLCPDLDVDLTGTPRGSGNWDIGALVYGAPEPDPSLVLHYSFDDLGAGGAGAKVTDITGNGHDMVFFGFPSTPTNWPTKIAYTNGYGVAANFWWDTNSLGQNGEGFYFGQYGIVTNRNSLTNLSAITVSVWARYYTNPYGPTGISLGVDHNATIVDVTRGTNGYTWYLGRESGYGTRFGIWTNLDCNTLHPWQLGFPDDATDTAGDTLGDHFYVATFNCTNQTMALYYDGVLCDSSNFTSIGGVVSNLTVGFGSPSFNSPPNSGLGLCSAGGIFPGSLGYLSIGCLNHDGTPTCTDPSDGYPNNGWLNGRIHDLRIYNRVLSADEIAGMYGIAYTVPPTNPPAPAVDLTNGLAAVWEMDLPSNNQDVPDAYAGTHILTNTLVSTASGQIQGTACAHFVNAASWFTCTNSDLLTRTNFTASMWVYPTDASGSQHFFTRRDSAPFVWWLQMTNGVFIMCVRDSANDGTWVAPSTVTVAPNKWHLVVVGFIAGAAANAWIQVDGEARQSVSTAPDITIMNLNPNDLLVIGNYGNGAVTSVSSKIDEAAFWGRELNTNEVTSLAGTFDFVAQTGTPRFYDSWSAPTDATNIWITQTQAGSGPFPGTQVNPFYVGSPQAYTAIVQTNFPNKRFHYTNGVYEMIGRVYAGGDTAHAGCIHLLDDGAIIRAAPSPTNSDGELFYGNGCNGFQVIGGTLDCNASNTTAWATAGAYAAPMTLNSVSDVLISNVTILNWGSKGSGENFGALIRGGDNCVIQHCVVNGSAYLPAGGTPLNIVNYSGLVSPTNLTIRDCTISNLSLEAVACMWAPTMTNNHCTNDLCNVTYFEPTTVHDDITHFVLVSNTCINVLRGVGIAYHPTGRIWKLSMIGNTFVIGCPAASSVGAFTTINDGDVTAGIGTLTIGDNTISEVGGCGDYTGMNPLNLSKATFLHCFSNRVDTPFTDLGPLRINVSSLPVRCLSQNVDGSGTPLTVRDENGNVLSQEAVSYCGPQRSLLVRK